MNKVAIIYWTGTGNTEMMAQKVLEGAKEAGADASLFNVSEFDLSNLDEYQGLAFGCPAMGAEVLEEGEFQPLWDEVKGKLGDKKVALFGSWGWGGGAWMESWVEDAKENGVNLVSEGVTCMEAPDEEASLACIELGKAIA